VTGTRSQGSDETKKGNKPKLLPLISFIYPPAIKDNSKIGERRGRY